MTQLKRQERMLARSNLHLEEFAHVASHDLRSPLRAIANTVEWLGEDLGENIADEIREHLDRLRLQARRAMTLVSDLHNYSKVGRKKELEEPVDIAMMVREIFESLPAARSMRLDVSGEPVLMLTAKAPLDLVLRNLIDNAVKYHDRPDGTIFVRWRQEGLDHRIRGRGQRPGNSRAISSVGFPALPEAGKLRTGFGKRPGPCDRQENRRTLRVHDQLALPCP